MANLNQSYQVGGGSSSAQSISNSNTYGTNASLLSSQFASNANSSAQEAWKEAAIYNAEEAQRQREWQERMANTVYQRTVADMKKAGINPILAVGNGIGSASAGSGATASMGSANTFMGTATADTISSAQSASHSTEYTKAEAGTITGLEAVSEIASSTIDAITSSKTAEKAKDVLENINPKNWKDNLSKWWDSIKNKPIGIFK